MNRIATWGLLVLCAVFAVLNFAGFMVAESPGRWFNLGVAVLCTLSVGLNIVTLRMQRN